MDLIVKRVTTNEHYTVTLAFKITGNNKCDGCIFLSDNSDKKCCKCNLYDHDLYKNLFYIVDQLTQEHGYVKAACDMLEDKCIIIGLYESDICMYLIKYINKIYEDSISKI